MLSINIGQAVMMATNLPEEHVHFVNVSRVQPYGVTDLGVHVLEGQEVIGHLRRAGHLAGPL